MSRLLAVALALCAASAWANKPRISILGFKGPKAPALRAQLSKQLCKAFTCVKPGKAEDVPVDAVVTGEVRAGKRAALSLNVYYDEDTTPVVRTLSLARPGKLAASAGKAAAGAVREAVELAAGSDAG